MKKYLNNIRKVTVIIPFKEDYDFLIYNISLIKKWSVLPSEIIIINTSVNKIFLNSFKIFCRSKKIYLRIVNKKNFYPGTARNFGIKIASNKLIAFLDVKTIPSKFWLEKAFNLLMKETVFFPYQKPQGIIGSTIFVAKKSFEIDFRNLIYGNQNHKTIPGSIFKKKFFKNNYFEKTRAGEDVEWMIKNQDSYIVGTETLKYYGLLDKNYIFFLKKWVRNYYHSTKLNYMKLQKLIFIFYLFLIILFTLDFKFWGNAIYFNYIFYFFIIIYLVMRILIPYYKSNLNISKLKVYTLFYIYILDLAKVAGMILSFLNIDKIIDKIKIK